MSTQHLRLAPILIVPVLAALMLTLFAWPAARLAPRNLPVGVVGAAQAAPKSSAFSFHRYPDAAAARHAIEQREVYGALVQTGKRPVLLVASAASPLVAQLLERAFSASSPPRAAASPRIVDVVPTPPQDPRGSAFASSVLPLVLAGIVAGGLLGLALRPGATQAGALAAASALAGLAAAAIAQSWLGVLEGPWLENAAVLALTVLAISAAIAGLGALLGLRGLALGAGLMMVIGNPFSAAASAPELLPKAAGWIGQLLPPGAGANLLRSTAFFDGAAAGGHLLVLAVWAGLGVLAIIAAGRLGAAGASATLRRELG